MCNNLADRSPAIGDRARTGAPTMRPSSPSVPFPSSWPPRREHAPLDRRTSIILWCRLRLVSAAACLHQAISIVPLYLPWFRGGSQSLPKFGADGYPHWTCRVGVGHGRRPPWLRLHYPRHVLAGDGARTLAAEPCIFGWIWPVFGATAAVSTVIASPSLRRVTARNLSGRRLEALLVLRLTARRRRATRGRR